MDITFFKQGNFVEIARQQVLATRENSNMATMAARSLPQHQLGISQSKDDIVNQSNTLLATADDS